MEPKERLGGMFVACGTAGIVAAVIAGTSLDGIYILWSALTYADRSPELTVAVAPYSIMSPLLIWSAVALGVLLIGLGLRISLRDPRRSADTGNGQRKSDGPTVEDTLRAWQRGR